MPPYLQASDGRGQVEIEPGEGIRELEVLIGEERRAETPVGVP